jgi:hypothetical protein
MATKKLGFDQRSFAVWFGREFAIQIPEDIATSVQPEILDAMSERYNGKSIKKLKKIIIDEEIQILKDANEYYHGNLSLMADIYHNHICNDRTLSLRKKAKLAVHLSKIKGLDTYQKEHGLNILEKLDELEQTK